MYLVGERWGVTTNSFKARKFWRGLCVAGAGSIGASQGRRRARVPRYTAEIVELFLGKPCVLSRKARNRPDAHSLLACDGPDTLACCAGCSDRLDLGCVIRDGCRPPKSCPTGLSP